MKIGSLKFLEKRVIGDEDDPLLIRYVVFRLPWFGLWVHKLCRSDHDRALHDHPWSFISIILKGGYQEVTDVGTLEHRPWSVLLRPAEWRHRVVIQSGKPSWNLIFVFQRRRLWGFWPDNNWCWWRRYDYQTGICQEELLWEDDDD